MGQIPSYGREETVRINLTFFNLVFIQSGAHFSANRGSQFLEELGVKGFDQVHSILTCWATQRPH